MSESLAGCRAVGGCCTHQLKDATGRFTGYTGLEAIGQTLARS